MTFNGQFDQVRPVEETRSVDLGSRYGVTPSTKRRDRWIAWTAAIAFTLVFGAWVVWVGLDGSSATIDGRDTGHVIHDDRSASISFDVSMTPGLTASCALQVQNNAHAIVGFTVVDIPASEKFTQSFTEVVRTTELGVTGLIYRCWLS